MAENPGPYLAATFGVGCFHFVDDDWDFEYSSPSFYSAQVRSLLQSVDNISNIEVNIGSGFLMFPLEPETTDYGGNGPFNPCPSSGHISFDVFLPERVQRQSFDDTFIQGCENFRVYISYDYDFPVTVIAPVGDYDISEDGFSSSVPIVREFLFEKLGTKEGVRFSYMGPSPFHAEFFLKISPEDHGMTINKRRGYDDVFFISPSDEPDSLAQFLQDSLRVISVYYYTVYTRNSLKKIENDTIELVRSVLSRLTEKKTLIKRITSINHSNKRDLAIIYSNIFEIEQSASAMKDDVVYSRSKMPEAAQKSPLWEFCNGEMKNLPNEIRRDLIDLIRLSEVFETSGANSRAVLIAALSSALLTCVATLAVALLK